MIVSFPAPGVKLTLRSYDPTVLKLLLDGVERTAKASAAMANAPAPTITFPHGTEAVRNDGALSARMSTVMKQVLGSKASFYPASAPGGTASEDFSEYIEAGVPSCSLWSAATIRRCSRSTRRRTNPCR